MFGSSVKYHGISIIVLNQEVLEKSKNIIVCEDKFIHNSYIKKTL